MDFATPEVTEAKRLFGGGRKAESEAKGKPDGSLEQLE